jgi:hypothetical protein
MMITCGDGRVALKDTWPENRAYVAAEICHFKDVTEGVDALRSATPFTSAAETSPTPRA